MTETKSAVRSAVRFAAVLGVTITLAGACVNGPAAAEDGADGGGGRARGSVDDARIVPALTVAGRSNPGGEMRDDVFEIEVYPEGGTATEGAVDSIAKAFEIASRAIREKRVGAGGVVISLRGGVYEPGSTIRVPASISGTESSPTLIRSFPGETATIRGGVALTGFRPVTDREVSRRLSPQARRNVVVVDLPNELVRDPGYLNPSLGNRPELYEKGVLAEPARYPNEGWLEIESVPQEGPRMIHPGLDRDTSVVPRGRHYGRFVYPGDRPSNWAPSDDIWVHGYWTWDWADEYLRVASLDTQAREVTPAEPHHRYGYTKGQRFAFINVFEELDAPGEWYLDRKERKLYYWPISADSVRNPGSIVYSTLKEPLLSIEGASFLTVESIVFEAGRGSGVSIRAGNHVTVAGCEFRNFGRATVVVDGGTNHTVSSCDIHDTTSGGISVEGGNRRTLEPGGHRVDNNHIHHFALRIKTYQPAIQVGGVGNTVSHNLIHHAPHMGMNIDGNDHLIERNEIYRIAEETGDVGAMYMGRDWTERGVIFRNNFIHDLEGPGDLGAMGIYLDDAAGGAEISGNLFYRAGRAILLGGGRDTTVMANLFVDCAPSIHLDARGLGWAAAYIVRGGSWEMYRKLAAIGYDRDPYASRYPALASILDGDPAIPTGNRITGNVSMGGRWLDLDAKARPVAVIEGNLERRDEAIEAFVRDLASGANPTPPPGLPDLVAGIPFTEIGLYENDYRRIEER
jgi:hypothetical protein